MASSTIFKNFNITVEDKSLIVITNEIIEGKYKKEVELVRAAPNKDEADKLKKQLLAFTPSATFSGGRKMEHFVNYSQFIILDFDKLTPEQLETAFNKAVSVPFTSVCFRSPSGNGIKILVQVNTGLQEHKQAWQQVADYYQKEIGIAIDPSGKDVTRLCFVSYDPQAYKNINSQTFAVAVFTDAPPPPETKKEEKKEEKKQPIENDHKERFQKCIDFTNQKSEYKDGNRNNYIHLLACNCNRSGIPAPDALDLIIQSFDLDAKEIYATIDNVYQNQTEEFGKFEDAAPFTETGSTKNPIEKELLNMPTLPDEIFPNLPGIIQLGCNAFETARERDIFLTGAITILSGCFTSVEGTYDQKTVYPNLNCFIIAPAASGKGALVFAKTLAQNYHDKLLNESMEAKRTYDIAMKQYKMKQRNFKKGDNTEEEEEPQAPPFKVLFIPGNSSSAAVIRHLMEGDEKGIFCETEADTMGQSFKQDWGGYSDLLRKAFHHESISYSRKTNNEYFEIKKPRLSVALSGTPSQVQGLISSAEDGLFSRFIFYTFKVKPEWRDVSPVTGKQNLTKLFENCAIQVFTMIEFLEQNPTEFNLTAPQWGTLNQKFKDWLRKVSILVSEEATSTVKRLGLIVYRISMILSAIRKFENGDCSKEIICEDRDFETAFKIAEVYKQHAMFMFTRLPKTENITDKKLKQFFEALPPTFQRKEAVAVGKQLKVEERTTDKYLKQLLTEKLLTQPEYGQYAKA